MTHDELLARIEKEHWHLFNFHWEDQSDEATEFRGAALAITRERLAVVELHKPVAIFTPCPDGKSGCAVLHYSNNKACSCGFFNYPCPTTQAIEREVK